MAIWSEPQLSIVKPWFRGAQKGSKGAQNDQKLGKYVNLRSVYGLVQFMKAKEDHRKPRAISDASLDFY